MFYFHTFTLLLQTQIKLICIAPLWHLISPLSLSLPCSIRCYKEFAEIKTTFVVFILSTPLVFDFRYFFLHKKSTPKGAVFVGASNGNRTRILSLGSSHSTIELYSHFDANFCLYYPLFFYLQAYFSLLVIFFMLFPVPVCV